MPDKTHPPDPEWWKHHPRTPPPPEPWWEYARHTPPAPGAPDRVFLPTTPATQMEWTVPMWCAGHAWRGRRGLGWLHRLGHKTRILRVQPPRPPAEGYIDG